MTLPDARRKAALHADTCKQRRATYMLRQQAHMPFYASAC